MLHEGREKRKKQKVRTRHIARWLFLLSTVLMLSGITAFADDAAGGDDAMISYAEGVEYYVALDGTWQRIAIRNNVVGKQGKRYYTTPEELEKIYGDFGFKASEFNGDRIFPHTAANDPDHVWADQAPSKDSDGNWKVLLAEKDKMFVYYLPANTEGHLSYFTNSKELSDKTLLKENMFCSVTISDPDKLTDLKDYYYVRAGEDYSFTLPTKDGYKWKCLDRKTMKEIEPTTTTTSEDGNKVTYTFKNLQYGIKIEPVNPKNNKIKIVYDAATVENNLEKLNQVTAGIQKPDYEGQVQGEGTFTTTISRNEQSYKLLNVDSKRVRVSVPSSSKNKKYWYKFNGWTLGDTALKYNAGDTLSVKELKSYEVNGEITLKATWTGLNTNGRIASCNFYVNRYCEIADNLSNGFSAAPEQDFTKSLYTAGVDEDNNLSVDKNGDLGILAPATEESGAYETDTALRSMVKTPYQGITFESFPSDEQVLENIRSSYSASNPIKVGDRVVTKDQLTTDNFKVRWYSFKFVHSDGWHVDGILVAKEGKLVVTKTFTGSAKKAISELKDKFSIDVTHKDKPTANDPDTEDYKLVIKPKSDAGSGETGYDSYNEKTNTYTWVLKARDYQTYNLKEKNYELEDFNNSSYTYTVRNNEANTDLESDGKDVSRQDLEWQKYSDDGVEVTAKAYPDDVPSTAYQTVSFRNMYVKAHYITIDKIDDFTINGMENVKFQISSLDEPDTFEVWKNPKANAYNYEEDDSEYGFTQRVEDNTLETDETGLIHIKLKPGAYILKEKNVEGYKAQPQFRIQVDEDGHIAESYPCDDAGNKVTNSDSDVVTSPSSSVISISNKAEELTSVTAKANMHDVKANSVQVELWCNGSKMSGSQYTQTLSKDDNWTYTWKNLPLYADGKVANYTLRETKIGDVSYDPGTNTDGFGDYIVTYDKCKYREADSGEYNDPASWTDDNGKHHYAKHALLVVHNENEKPEELVLSVNAKILWNDKNNQDGIRPDYMDLKIEDADGEQSGNSLELNADNGWAAKFVELNKYKNNHETSYAVTDKCFTSPEGYTAEITGDMVNGFVITLTHKPETTTIEGTKAWSDSGKKNLRPDSITVSLLADGEKVDETTTTADKNWKFSFDNKPVYKDGKKITYTVKEQDPAAYYQVSTSKDDDGNYIITNKYQPESVKEKTRVTTVVTGKNAVEAFKYELTPAEDYGDAVKMPENNTVTTSDGIQKNQSEDKNFDSIEFTKEGTYTFHVKTLTKATHGGWIYDNEVKTLKVHVVDENGQLRVADADSTTSATMTHSFTPTALEGDTAITLRKTLTGRNMLDGEKFDFTLSVADEATKEAVKDGDINLAETKASASGLKDGETATVSFGRVEFSEAGEYTFQVKETDGGKPGMTYDTEAKTFKVKVTDEDGVLKATQESVPTIQNVYKASGSFTPEGTKTLLSPKGNKLSVGENQFKFDVRYLPDADGEPVATGTTGSGKDAKIDFGTLSYNTESLAKLMEKGYADSAETDNGREYYIDYIVTERATGNDAIQKNTETRNIRVVLKDDGAGKLAPSIEGDQSLDFENRYVTDTATVSMDGSKVMEGRDLSKDEFSFHITSDDADAPMPKETTVKNDAAGNVSFGDITYTKDDLGDANSKAFEYKVTESGSKAGVTNDSETKTVKVTVKDDGKGHITAEADPGAAPLFTFTNKYSAAPTESAVTDSVKVKKMLEGGSLAEGQFHFVMKDGSGDVVARASNKADGSIDFPALKFTKVGTYNYTIAEEVGDSSHVTYDDTVYNVTASVTDDFQGKLHVEWNCGVKTISFHNVYTATPVSVEPQVVKTITGDTPEAKETFRFALSGVSVETKGSGDSGSEAVGSSESVKSAMPPMPEGSEDGTKTIEVEGEGTGYFGPITFEKAGTYRYQVIEETGSNADYTYDTTVYELTYVVTDKDGELQVKESIQAQPENKAVESMSFTNKYQKPVDPTPNPDPGKGDHGNNGTNGNQGQNGQNGGSHKANGGHANGGNNGNGSHISSHTPQTGDEESTGFFLGLMGISAAMLAGVTGLRKKFALKK